MALARASPVVGLDCAKAAAKRRSIRGAISFGRWSITFRRLWMVQRWMSALSPKTLTTPLASAFAPSSTTRRPASAERPRATRSARSAVTTVLFSVSPNHRPLGTLRPSVAHFDHRLRISRYHAALTVENDAIDHRHGHRQTR